MVAIASSAATAEGYYSEQAFNHFTGKMFIASHLVETQNTKDIIDFVREGKGLGLVFSSDAAMHNDISLLSGADEGWHDPIIFQGVVIAGPEMAAARGFLDFLTSAEAQRLFIKYGFYPPSEKPANLP